MTLSEINEAVARKLGWTDIKQFNKYGVKFIGHQAGKDYQFKEGNPQECLDEKYEGWDVLPDYCHSIEAAWEIPTKLPEIPYDNMTAGFQLSIDVDGMWEAGWCSYPECFIVSAQAPTAPMAICLAFLKLP